MVSRAIGAAVGLLADHALGEPIRDPHPVALLGRACASIEGVLWADARSSGVVHALVGGGMGALAGAAIGSTAVATWVGSAGRELRQAALAVDDALAAGDLDRARALLPTLVGRDPSELDEPEIVRAVIESVAENTVDAVVAHFKSLDQDKKKQAAQQINQNLAGLFDMDNKIRTLVWMGVFGIFAIIAIGCFIMISSSFGVSITTISGTGDKAISTTSHPDMAAAWAVLSAIIAGVVGILVPSPASKPGS